MAAVKKKAKKATKVAKKTSVKKKAAPKKAAAKKAAPKKAKAKPKAKKPAAPKKPKDVLPTPEEETRFWSLLEDAWATQSPEANAARKALATRTPSSDDDLPDGLDEAVEGVIDSLRAAFASEDFPKEELVAMDRVLERKLYDIDRADVQRVTDGSDDGFLYARGFIVAMGKELYDAVVANPKMAICDAEAESMCYLPSQVHNERFGSYPERGTSISRESCSNRDGWANADDDDDGDDGDDD